MTVSANEAGDLSRSEDERCALMELLQQIPSMQPLESANQKW